MSSFKKKHDGRPELSKADVGFYKMTGVFAIACVFVLLALKMQNTGTEYVATGRNLTNNFYEFCRTPIFAVIATAAFVGAVAWFAVCRKNKIDESHRIFASTDCLAVVLYLGFFSACFGIKQGSNLHGFFVVATIFVAALFYASKIYKADFIVYSAITAVIAMSIYLWAMLFEPHIVVIKLLVIAAGVLTCVAFRKKIASLKLSKQTKSSFLVFPCYIVLVLGAVLLFWAYFQNMEFFRATPGLQKVQSIIFLNRSMMLFGVVMQYIVFAIVYTVRRIKD